MDDLRYPVGKHEAPKQVTIADRARWLDEVEQAPAKMRAAVAGLDDRQLDTPYRPGGWTARQVVHHVPDSHMNAYVRFRLALTEDAPTIKPYGEALWAELPDARTAPIDLSLSLLEAIHRRWVLLLRGLDDAQWKRPYLLIPSTATRRSTPPWPCTRGTAATTWGMSPACVSAPAWKPANVFTRSSSSGLRDGGH